MSYFLNDVEEGGEIVFPLANNKFEVNHLLVGVKSLFNNIGYYRFSHLFISVVTKRPLKTAGRRHEQFW